MLIGASGKTNWTTGAFFQPKVTEVLLRKCCPLKDFAKLGIECELLIKVLDLANDLVHEPTTCMMDMLSTWREDRYMPYLLGSEFHHSGDY